MGKGKIAVITLHNVLNYGSVLQTFATQKKMESLGFEVEIIDYVRPNTTKKNILNTYTSKDKGIKKVIKKIIWYPSIRKAGQVFDVFLRKYIKLSEHTYFSEEDFRKYPIAADIYCTGSDQVWNSIWNDGLVLPFYLDFVSEGKKISYAASIGTDDLSREEEEPIKELLTSYAAISVRESSAVQILKKLGIDSVQILDPTLMMPKKFWIEYIHQAEATNMKKRYLLVYQLNTNKEFNQYVKKVAKAKSLKIVRICRRYDQILQGGQSVIVPEPMEFISYIAGAELLITDSFHGTAFAVNLNIDFITVNPPKFCSRINSLLELLNLQERLLKSYDDISLADKKIDFSEANERLARERDKGNDFLRKAIVAKS